MGKFISPTVLCLINFSFGSEVNDPRPYIVLIVSDDQGYVDVSSQEHSKEVHTPHIDRLAREGVLLTNGYASAWVCAPTRAGLLTGRYQQRFWDGGSIQWAVRKGQWKIRSNRQGKLELYDLERDKSESQNQAGKHPDIVEKLKRTYEEWKKEMTPPLRKPRARK